MKTTLAAGALAVRRPLRAASLSKSDRPALKRFERHRMFLGQCTVPGETRKDGVFPAHPNSIQLSRDRWLLLFSTRGLRGVDDDRSIIYQTRRDRPDGPVIREGRLAQAVDDWEPLGDGRRYAKQHAHPVAFGVPLGARLHGKPAPNANLFVIKWIVLGVTVDPSAGRIHLDWNLDHRIVEQTLHVVWTQVRLNASGDDLEIVEPAARMRQTGFASDAPVCSLDVQWMNQAFVQAVPYNADCTEWVDCNHFDRGRIAALRHRYNPARHRYEWVETSQSLFDRPVFEGALAKVDDGWLVAARPLRGDEGVAWLRAEDLFHGSGHRILHKDEPATACPRTLFRCADGVLRLLTGDKKASPSRDDRDPLFMWDVDPQRDFALSNRREVFRSKAAGLSPACQAMLDNAKIVASCGDSQLLLYRITPRVYEPKIAPADAKRCGIYCGRLVYDAPLAPDWDFGENQRLGPMTQ